MFRKVLETVDKKFMGPEPDTKGLADTHEREVVQSATAEDFEHRMNRMLRDLGASHTGFFTRALHGRPAGLLPWQRSRKQKP